VRFIRIKLSIRALPPCSRVMLAHSGLMRYSVRKGSDGRSSLRKPYRQRRLVITRHSMAAANNVVSAKKKANYSMM
jgi:hypothetical protein